MKYINFTAIPVLLFLLSNAVAAEDNHVIPIGLFSSADLSNWNSKSFSGTTNYQLIQLEGIRVLKAESQSSASGLFKELRVDLHKTPFINWRWRIDKRLENLDEQHKSGDDYSARIFVVISGGWMFWRTRAINYVWAGNSPQGFSWPNAFAGKNSMVMALRSKNDRTHTWYQEKRNVLEDLKTQFGSDFRYIDAVALMTDTDNAQGDALSYYGDIFFSEK